MTADEIRGGKNKKIQFLYSTRIFNILKKIREKKFHN